MSVRAGHGAGPAPLLQEPPTPARDPAGTPPSAAPPAGAHGPSEQQRGSFPVPSPDACTPHGPSAASALTGRCPGARAPSASSTAEQRAWAGQCLLAQEECGSDHVGLPCAWSNGPGPRAVPWARPRGPSASEPPSRPGSLAPLGTEGESRHPGPIRLGGAGPPQGGRTRGREDRPVPRSPPHTRPRAWRPGWRAERGPPPRAPVPWHRVPPFLGAEALGGLAGPGGHPSSPPSTQAAAQVPHAFQQLHEDRAASVRPGARVLGASQGWGSGKSPGVCGRLLF